jgi:4a-hydroxytetrahydrobiopterin dehydratase
MRGAQHPRSWRVERGRRPRRHPQDFRFTNFNQAFAFMTQVMLMAEKMGCHLEWFNSTISSTSATHDAGGVTDRDIRLAGFMEEAAAQP